MPGCDARRARFVLSVLVLGLMFGVGPASARYVACVGDSDTYGPGLGRAHAYPGQLERILRPHDPQWEVGNFGVNGAGVLKSGLKPYVNQGAFFSALASEPDVVIIGLGGNDAFPGMWAKDDFVADYLELISAFTALPSQPEIWLCTVGWFVSSPWGHDRALIRDEVNPAIREVGASAGSSVIDVYALLEDRSDLFQPDGVHWNGEGASLVAEMVAAAVLGRRWPPDFNGDSRVDIEDLVTLIEHWGQDEPAIDIAPGPIGDHVVDVQDLEVLMDCWGQAPYDHTLAAHWGLDETEGEIALDSVGASNGTVHGGATWQADEGIVGGAMAFDGVDDYVESLVLLDLTGAPFSVLAWIKGGGEKQVAISLIGEADWLKCSVAGRDGVEGKLATEFGSPALTSGRAIINGQWHRIGLVWDGTSRVLYVDGVAVARDEPGGASECKGRLHIGCGADKSADSYFCGLIDDVRVYGRAIKP